MSGRASPVPLWTAAKSCCSGMLVCELVKWKAGSNRRLLLLDIDGHRWHGRGHRRPERARECLDHQPCRLPAHRELIQVGIGTVGNQCIGGQDHLL